MNNILILDGTSAAALAFTRALGSEGYRISIGYAGNKTPPSCFSKFCFSSFIYPSPIIHFPDFLLCLNNYCEDNEINFVIPTAETTLFPLSKNRDHFNKNLTLIIPQNASLEIALDKHKTLNAAKALNIPTPESFLINNVDQLTKILFPEFPLVVKDRYSIFWDNNVGKPGTTQYAYNQKELFILVKERLNTVSDVLVQSLSIGTGIGFSCLIHDGNIYAPFQWERIREKIPTGSGSSSRRSMAITNSIYTNSTNLLKAINYSGIAMVEYKGDIKSNNYVLMEINGRPWGSIQLPIHCGVNYPKFLVDLYIHNKLPDHLNNYRAGIECRWIVGDLIHLENLLRKKPDLWPGNYPKFFVSLINILIFWKPNLRYDHFSFKDIKPWLIDIELWFSSRARSFFAKLSSKY